MTNDGWMAGYDGLIPATLLTPGFYGPLFFFLGFMECTKRNDQNVYSPIERIGENLDTS